MKDKNTLKTSVLVSQLLDVVHSLTQKCCCGRAVVRYTFHFSEQMLRMEHVIVCAAETVICGHSSL
jgi:hypothetical protein